ncbi:MAG: hypothetical protein GX663_02125 [Clostridiales bacterium]|nr:hypothetical protein [Clostridiales bacterium]
MEFTYNSYGRLITLLGDNAYEISNYKNFENKLKPVILRHDIDWSIDKGLRLAEFEASLGVSSTYFVMVTSPFYNIAERNNIEKLKKIVKLKHEIGLHFDELNYSEDCYNANEGIEGLVQKEATILGTILNTKVSSVSMHRPSEETLNMDYQFEGIINSYSKKFFREFKYVSDSRGRWRENVCEIISSNKYNRLHILTHAFLYSVEGENISDATKKFINSANKERYKMVADNITNVDELVTIHEVR